MKICPRCNLSYYDNTMEFCLEDGAKLLKSESFTDKLPTVANSNRLNPSIPETINLPNPNIASNVKLKNAQIDTIDTIEQKFAPDTIKSNLIHKDTYSQNYKILEVAPIIISLAHNWWQWLYLNNQYYSSFYSYIISANFLMWLLLLITGTIVGLLGLKYCRNKNFAYTSLIILSINLLLFLVPKR